MPRPCTARGTGNRGSARDQIRGRCFVLLGFLCRGGDAKPRRDARACRRSEDEGKCPRRAPGLREGHVERRDGRGGRFSEPALPCSTMLSGEHPCAALPEEPAACRREPRFSDREGLASPISLPCKSAATPLLPLGLGKEKFGAAAFLPPASPGSRGYISANSCKRSRDH